MQAAGTSRRHQRAGRCPMEPTAFHDLAIQEIDAVYRMASLLARNLADTSDLVQETYRRAFAVERGFEPSNSGVRLWLLSILHNVFHARTWWNERQPDTVVPREFVADDTGADILNSPCWNLATVDWARVDNRLKRAITEMSTGDREVLHLWAVENPRDREIAAVLGVPIRTEAHRLHRVRSLLSRYLADLTGGHMVKANEQHRRGSRHINNRE